MDQSSFKDRFSLDFLSPAARYATQVPEGMDLALDSLGAQLLSNMKVAPNQTSALLDLAKASSTRLEVVFPVVQHLASKGLVERIVEDPSGNDTYRLTLAGEKTKL